MTFRCAFAIAFAVGLAACGPPKATVASVDAERHLTPIRAPPNWLTYGRTYAEQRFSPLDADQRDNVGSSGLAWYRRPRHRPRPGSDAARGRRRDVRLHRAGSKVKAYRRQDRRADVVLRSQGAAASRARSLLRRGQPRRRRVEGQGVRRHARRPPDRARRRDRQRSLVRRRPPIPAKPYTITGAPRVVKGKVSSATAAPSSACAATSPPTTPTPASRPGASTPCPAIPAEARFEQPMLETAAKTWPGEWWKHRRRRHGRGTPSSTIPSSTCSISAPATARRGATTCAARAAGDNLFLSSIVAVKPDTGEYVWHYQTTPGDELGLHRHAADHASPT